MGMGSVRRLAMTAERQAATAAAINDLDRQIEHHDAQARRARERRRELRMKLKRGGWTWRELGALSDQTMYAVQKDAQRG
jgi:hypothetical protein